MSADNLRLDKWLWAARFFKTRALAAAAIGSGKVHSGGQPVKPSRPVKLNDCYVVRRGSERIELVVTGLSDQRGPAAVAQQLYRETEDSMAQRKLEAQKRKLAALARPRSEGRPDKKQRRQIRRFIDKP